MANAKTRDHIVRLWESIALLRRSGPKPLPVLLRHLIVNVYSPSPESGRVVRASKEAVGTSSSHSWPAVDFGQAAGMSIARPGLFASSGRGRSYSAAWRRDQSTFSGAPHNVIILRTGLCGVPAFEAWFSVDFDGFCSTQPRHVRVVVTRCPSS